MESEAKDNFYRIGELAEMLGVTPRTIRYYEELGLLESAGREEGAHRKYNERNVIRLKRIQQLKDYGLTLADIGELFDLARRERTGKAAEAAPDGPAGGHSSGGAAEQGGAMEQAGASVRKLLAEKYRERLKEALRRRAALDEYIEELSWHVEQLDRVKDFFQCPGASCDACAFAGRCDVRLLLKKD